MTITGFRRPSPVGRTATAAELDASQAAVLRTRDDESLAVVGAPGSGKTTTLVELLAHRVHVRGIAPDAVVAIVPTRPAATALRDRLALRIGVPTSGPLARTIGSVAFQIVQTAAVRDGTEAPRLLTGSEQDAMFSDILSGDIEDGTGPEWPPSHTPEVRSLQGFRTELRELYMRTVEAGVLPAELAALGAETGRQEWVAAAEFFATYGEIVDSLDARYLDAAELVAEAVRVVRDGGDIPPWRLVAVDDLQELGAGEIRLLRALARRGVTIAGFGDPDVAVTTFRGSDLTALASLGDRLGVPVTRLVLDAVHRGGAGVRALVTEVTERVGAAGVVEHRRATVAGRDAEGDASADVPPVLRIEAPSPAGEYRLIARVLREHHLLRGVPWSRMAVVVRSGALVPGVSRALALAEVPTEVPVGSVRLRDAFASRQLILAAGMVVGRIERDATLLTELATGPLCGLDSVALRRLRLALRHEDVAGGGSSTGEELLTSAFGHENGFATIDSAAARKAGRFARVLAAATRIADEGGSIEEILWAIWDGSGLASTWGERALGSGLAADEANRNLDAVMALFTSAKRYVERFPSLPATGFIDEVLSAELPEDSLTPQAQTSAVWVGTPSSVVARDVDVVVAAHLEDGAWPNPQIRGSLLFPQLFSQIAAGLPSDALDPRAEVLSDEVRMLALVVSRARTQAVLSATANDDEQPSAFFRFRTVREAPCRDAEESRHPFTLRGYTGMLRRTAVHAPDPQRRALAASAIARLASEGVAGASPDEWYGLAEPSTTEPLVDLDAEDARVSVSPSRLETFEKSPLVWFVDQMAAVPSGLAAGIGTIVHAAMEKAGRIPAAELTPDLLSPERLWADVESRWGELGFEAPWIAEGERRRAVALVEAVSAYLTDSLEAGSEVVSAEGRFSLELELGAGRVVVNGAIDRVERRKDGSIVIIDLKTGRHAVTEREAATNAQMSAYQLAHHEGAVPGADAAEPSGGAALLYVAKPDGRRRTAYTLRRQEPADDEAREEFRRRVVEAAKGMAGTSFPGQTGLGDFDPAGGVLYRIHLVAAVSA